MIKAEITDNTYEPYAESVKSEFAKVKSTLGFTKKNLLKNTAVTQASNGVTFTVNADKSITIKGTATTTTWVKLDYDTVLPIGKTFIASLSK